MGWRGGGGERAEQPAEQADRVVIAHDPVSAGLAVEAAEEADGDDRSACGAGVDASAQRREAVAQRNAGWGEEGAVLTAGVATV
ncbi:MAG TPA: hypothetical protein VE673_19345 [Pseudonocardiaceae bacterium]|nr:hypothetical protein [Pseudonocardiaceae bacterium]